MKFLKKFEMLIRPDISTWRDNESRKEFSDKWLSFDFTQTSPKNWKSDDFKLVNDIINDIKHILTDIGCRVETSHKGSGIQYTRQPLDFENFKEHGVPFLVIHKNIPDPSSNRSKKNKDLELGFYYWLDEFLDRLEGSLPEEFVINPREVLDGSNVDTSKVEVVIYKKA